MKAERDSQHLAAVDMVCRPASGQVEQEDGQVAHQAYQQQGPGGVCQIVEMVACGDGHYLIGQSDGLGPG